jgi:hypothetical protein
MERFILCVGVMKLPHLQERWACSSEEVARVRCSEALPQKSEPFLDRVSTGSGSDLVNDQHAVFPNGFRLLRLDQVATAPCTDPIQVQLLLLRQAVS